jgi:hypothetical protein
MPFQTGRNTIPRIGIRTRPGRSPDYPFPGQHPAIMPCLPCHAHHFPDRLPDNARTSPGRALHLPAAPTYSLPVRPGTAFPGSPSGQGPHVTRTSPSPACLPDPSPAVLAPDTLPRIVIRTRNGRSPDAPFPGQHPGPKPCLAGPEPPCPDRHPDKERTQPGCALPRPASRTQALSGRPGPPLPGSPSGQGKRARRMRPSPASIPDLSPVRPARNLLPRIGIRTRRGRRQDAPSPGLKPSHALPSMPRTPLPGSPSGQGEPARRMRPPTASIPDLRPARHPDEPFTGLPPGLIPCSPGPGHTSTDRHPDRERTLPGCALPRPASRT